MTWSSDNRDIAADLRAAQKAVEADTAQHRVRNVGGRAISPRNTPTTPPATTRLVPLDSLNATARLTPKMRRALKDMPIPLEIDGALPQWGPHGGTLKALERRGLIEFDGFNDEWRLTPLGEEAERAV